MTVRRDSALTLSLTLALQSSSSWFIDDLYSEAPWDINSVLHSTYTAIETGRLGPGGTRCSCACKRDTFSHTRFTRAGSMSVATRT